MSNITEKALLPSGTFNSTFPTLLASQPGLLKFAKRGKKGKMLRSLEEKVQHNLPDDGPMGKSLKIKIKDSDRKRKRKLERADFGENLSTSNQQHQRTLDCPNRSIT
ncbi:uncharacterized protein LOC144068885 [Stigmatopora argus]